MRVPVKGGPQDGAELILRDDYRVVGNTFHIIDSWYVLKVPKGGLTPEQGYVLEHVKERDK